MKDIDREVAELVMGWKFISDAGGVEGAYLVGGNIRSSRRWSPSTRIDDAFEVVKKMHSTGLEIMMDYHLYRYSVSFVKDHDPEVPASATEDTAPLAICKAALEAVK